MRGSGRKIPGARGHCDRNGVMSTPPAGWYPDPAMAQTQRYWDGQQWTSAVAPLNGAQAPTDHGPGSVEHWLIPVGRSGPAIAAGYVGIVALVFAFLGFVGVIVGAASLGLGIWALTLARKGKHGSGRAIFAIVAGVIGIVAGLWSLTSIW